MEDVTFEHNTSIQVGAGYRLSWSSDSAVLENTVRSFWPNRSLVGMRLAGANHDLRIVGNDIQASLTGIVSGSFLPSNTDVLIQGNSITAAPGLTATGAGIGMGVGALLDSRILDNTVTGLQGLGIGLLSGNTNNLVRGNSVTHNGGDGISAAAGATGNTFELNVMHDNAGVDARDVAGPDGLPVNTWRFNECGTDIPEGTICGVE
jgi:hypothetical protein